MIDWPAPATVEDVLRQECDWFYLVTGRDPTTFGCSRRTLNRLCHEEGIPPDPPAFTYWFQEWCLEWVEQDLPFRDIEVRDGLDPIATSYQQILYDRARAEA